MEQRCGPGRHSTTRRTAGPDPTPSLVYAAARSRPKAPTTALWHAVEIHRAASEVDGASELTVCSVLARIATGEPWPPATRDLCPVCVALAR